MTAIRDTLVHYGLPPGLLPANTVTLDVDEASGRFTARLSGEHKAKVAGFTVVYAPTITGTFRDGVIDSLDGVKVKVAIAKLSVTGIARSPSGTKVVFTVAGARKGIPISEFA